MLWKWPFNPEDNVQLMWIKSPFRNDSKEWMVPLILRDNGGETRLVEMPWGLFPGFRLGQYYADGVQVEAYKSGSVLKFEIEEPNKGILSKLCDIPDGIIDNELLFAIKDEYVWVCNAGEMTLYFPCIELVRALLAPNSTLAHALLELNGLDLIASCKIFKASLHLIVNQTVPKGLITEDFILHLAWLFSDPVAKRTWNTILLGIRPRGDFEVPLYLFKDVINDEEIKPKKLKAILPLTGRSALEVRGIQKGEHFLVYEIVTVGNMSLPFAEIIYSKKPIIKQKIVESDITLTSVKRIRRKKVLQNIGIDENPNSVSKTIMSRLNNNILLFNHLPEIHNQEPIINKERIKHSKKERQYNLPENEREPVDEKDTQAMPEQLLDKSLVQERLFSGAEVLYTGNSNVHPIEFHAPSISNTSIGYGLEPFFNAIDYLNKIDGTIIIINYKVDVMPTGKPFSRNEDGGIRKYALVTVKFGKETRYIIEIERLRKIYLSTLIIESRNKLEFEDQELYEILGGLLVGLIRNYGNWDINLLQNHPKARIYQVKHLEQWSALDWAITLYNRLGVQMEIIPDCQTSIYSQ